MAVVRRLYLYAMSGITLAVLAAGLQLLLDILFGQLGVGRGGTVFGFVDADRQQLSLAAALVGVGLPVWAVHWYLVGRSLRPGTDEAESERRSSIRALYLAAALAVTAFTMALAGRELIGWVLRSTIDVRVPAWYFDDPDPSGAAATLVVGLIAWVFHASVRRGDVAAGPLFGAAAWWHRVYLYGAAMLGLVIAAETIGSMISVAFGPVPSVDAIIGAPSANERTITLIDRGAELAAYVTLWAVHWWLAARSLAGTGWRAIGERQARVRLGYLVAVVVFAVAQVVQLGGEALGASVPGLLGARDAPVLSDGSARLATAIVIPLASATPWLLAWWYHRRRMLAEAHAPVPGAAPPATVARLDLHGTSMVGLAFGAAGIGWLVGLAIDVAFGGSRTLGEAWMFEVATYLPFALIGFALWAWTWTRLRRRRALDPIAEASSTTRRVALLIVFGAALVTTIGSLALVLYRVFAVALGVLLPGDPVSELSTPVGALLTALVVAVYHGLTVRSDATIAARASGESPGEGEGRASGAARVSRLLVLHGPADSDPHAAVSALRDALPPGFELDER